MYFVHTMQIKELKLSLLKITLEIEAEWNLALTWAGTCTGRLQSGTVQPVWVYGCTQPCSSFCI